ncbi:MYB DNA-binding domain-containing protein [Paracoccidioides lutzii Pb01]|uniref:MYB DNA-binding domain-containing protein n=1 Tax=Paracoccidioides lutzii (strain ATCC MYA-826 / Pb01) TaxID=502779 RepID=C1HB85_PARBA|nr:MYB DNA-binding domain-containing protein [Paracoccidioides lutzii Pb01]EEH37608.2 MYB DNA-binding domain-containing protein [Paracoccidioides lutzii Pb01]
MKWGDISNRIPGRSATSCRLHYQNYLERRSEWDEDRKNKLARQYERLKKEMWDKIAELLGLPWRAVEAMHWQLGKQEMARRAGVIPFSLSSTTSEPPQKRRRLRATTPRSRRDAGTRGVQGQQLPSVAELSAGAAAYASSQSREHYSLRKSPKSPAEQSRGYVGTRLGGGTRSRR